MIWFKIKISTPLSKRVTFSFSRAMSDQVWTNTHYEMSTDPICIISAHISHVLAQNQLGQTLNPNLKDYLVDIVISLYVINLEKVFIFFNIIFYYLRFFVASTLSTITNHALLTFSFYHLVDRWSYSFYEYAWTYSC